MNVLQTVKQAVSGKKVYLVCFATIIYAAFGWYTGQLDQPQAIQMIFAALGAVGFRSAMKKT